MKIKEDIEKLDKKMQKDGWEFFGPILHYKKAWKKQASIYKKEKKFVITGIDSTGEKEFIQNISKKEAEKQVKQSLKEIRKFMFTKIE